MPYYRSMGHVPQKRHTQHRAGDGTLYFEELMGEEGFSSDSSLLYHRSIPSAISEYRVWELPDLSTIPNHPLVPLHFSTHQLFDEDNTDVDAVTGRRLLLGNHDVRLSYVVADTTSPPSASSGSVGPRRSRSEYGECSSNWPNFERYRRGGPMWELASIT